MKNKRLHHRAISAFAPFAGSLFRNRPENHTLKWFLFGNRGLLWVSAKAYRVEWSEIELIGAEIVDGEAFLQEYNIDRESIFSDSLSEKYALFHISVTKVSDSPLLTYYRFDYCGAEKDGWRNLVSPEIFESLNPLAKKPSQLSVGETEELAMAIGLHKDAFRNTEWSNLSTSDISLVMSVYPQKVILQSS